MTVETSLSGVRYDVSPLGLGKNWVTDVGGLPLFARAIAHALIRSGHSESDAIQLAIGAIQNWASGQTHVTPKTRAKAVAALAEWEAKRVAAHGESAAKSGTRSQQEVEGTDGSGVRTAGFVGETTGTGADKLLPVGPSPKQEQEIVQTQEAHRFKGSTLMACTTCGQPVTAAIHKATGKRHAGPDHEHVPTGHIKGSRKRHIQAARAQYESDLAKVEPGIEQSMKDHFSMQRQATISRLTGKRGKTMLKRAAELQTRATTGPDAPEGITAPTPPVEGANPAAVDPSAVFDATFWKAKLAGILQQHFNVAQAVAAARVKSQVGATPTLDDRSSLGAVQSVLDTRAVTSAMQITGTTRRGIFEALQEGLANQTTIQGLTDRVNAVFDTADAARAHMIAQTEGVGSLNQAAHIYAANLPTGVVGSKMWLSHHDTRTRPAHRLADGQAVPMNRPYLVGGFPMMFPGDPVAPPNLVINCRCFGAETVVDAANVLAAYRRGYKGFVVEVTTAEGNQLTGTPNHPILTPTGWVPLGSLREGDQVVNGRSTHRMTGRNPDVPHMPSPIGELYDSVALTRAAAYRVGGSLMDFHGDGTEGHVDVVLTHAGLAVYRDAALAKESGKFVLTGAHGEVRLPGDHAAGVGVGHSEGLCLGSPSDRNASAHQARPDGAAVIPVGFGEGLLGLSGQVSLGDFRGVEDDAFPTHSHLAHNGPDWAHQPPSLQLGTQASQANVRLSARSHESQAGHIQLDTVFKVTRKSFAGHVYNLSTVTERYVAEGIVAHNCGQAFLPPGMSGSVLGAKDLMGLVPASTQQAWGGVQAAREANAVKNYGNPIPAGV